MVKGGQGGREGDGDINEHQVSHTPGVQRLALNQHSTVFVAKFALCVVAVRLLLVLSGD